MDSRHKILVVDDDSTNLFLLQGILERHYALVFAKNGPDALKHAARGPDLILLDINMPDMDGFEVCRRLKADETTREIPVLFVTALTQTGDETQGLELGAVDYITKPIAAASVLARIRNHLYIRDAQKRLANLSVQLSRYLSPQIYQSIFDGRQDALIGTRRKKLTIFFSDIVGFTSLTESLAPEDLNTVLNGYLNRMAEIVLQHGGTLDKFIGDAIMVFFGDPASLGVREDALACVRMAMEMRNAVKALADEWSDLGVGGPLRVRMGIATGYCTVGNFGSARRMDYTVVGEQVNLASRLESCAEPDQILVSQETWTLVQSEIHCIRREPVQVKGINRAVPAYQVADVHAHARSDQRLLESCQGFSLSLDPDVIAGEDRAFIVDKLRLAIARLQE